MDPTQRISIVTITIGIFFAGTVGATTSSWRKIVGGRHAYPGEAPYQLSLQYNGFHFCGASLVQLGGVQFAISAAHCFSKNWVIKLVAGDLNLNDSSGAEQERQVSGVVTHPDYWSNETALVNDIALLFFSSPFNLNENVSTIALPSPQLKNPEGNIIVTGWSDLYYDGHAPNDLQLVELSLISDEICEQAWSTDEGTLFTETMLCANVPGGDQSPCHGDSGGFAWSYEYDSLVGIVSFVKDNSCGRPDYPAVFTEVAYFVEWIETEVDNFMGKKTNQMNKPFTHHY